MGTTSRKKVDALLRDREGWRICSDDDLAPDARHRWGRLIRQAEDRLREIEESRL